MSRPKQLHEMTRRELEQAACRGTGLTAPRADADTTHWRDWYVSTLLILGVKMHANREDAIAFVRKKLEDRPNWLAWFDREADVGALDPILG
jgi:hypothetical protein